MPTKTPRRKPRARSQSRAPRGATLVESLQSPTLRATVLVVMLALLVLSVAVPLRSWLRQSDQNTQLAAEVGAREQRVAELEEQLRDWEDPDFIEQQARDRLHYVYPGETGYIVTDGEEPARSAAPPQTAPLPGSWYERLWRSVEDSAS